MLLVSVTTCLRLLVFLCLQLFASICAFAVVLSSGINGINHGSFQAFQWLVAASIIIAIWSLVLLLLDSVALARGRVSDALTPTLVRVIGDFVSMPSC